MIAGPYHGVPEGPSYCVCESGTTTLDGLGECSECGRVPKTVIDARLARRG